MQLTSFLVSKSAVETSISPQGSAGEVHLMI